MLTVDEALSAVLRRVAPLPPRRLPIAEALGLTLAEDVNADIDLPPFDKALMDGYAVRSVDLSGGENRLRVIEQVMAGQLPTRPLGPGDATEVMTGAPLPASGDAVVAVERTRRDGPFVVFDDSSIVPGRNVLPRGREMRAGEVVARIGERLTPARLGLLASVGRVNALIVPRPTVIIVSTGDELVEPDRVPGPGQIRNSNATVLAALVKEAGGSARTLPIASDDPETLNDRIGEALGADIVLITGGVSAGKLDLVPGTLERLGVSEVFHKVRVKPGKPLWFGVGPGRDGGTGPLVFGLPGNPVSGLIGFVLFVRPALEGLAGRARRVEPFEARLARPFHHKGDRPTYHPTRSLGGNPFEIEPLDWAGSADLRGVAAADGFAIFPAGDRAFLAGEIVGYLPLG